MQNDPKFRVSDRTCDKNRATEFKAKQKTVQQASYLAIFLCKL